MRTLELDRRGPVVPSAAAVATIAAGILAGDAIGTGSPDPAAYTLAGAVAAMPAALAFALWSTRRPAAALLGTLGVLTFSLTLAFEVGPALTLQPLLVGGVAVGVAGLIGVAAGRSRPPAILEGLVLAWLGTAFIFEATVFLHGV